MLLLFWGPNFSLCSYKKFIFGLTIVNSSVHAVDCQWFCSCGGLIESSSKSFTHTRCNSSTVIIIINLFIFGRTLKLLVESQKVTMLEHFRRKCIKLTYNAMWELSPIGLICFSQFSVSISLR